MLDAAPLEIFVGNEVTFDGSSSFHPDPNRSIVSFVYDFDDGSPIVESMDIDFEPTHEFDAVGEYEVSLTVSDDGIPSLSNTAYVTINVVPEPSVIVLVGLSIAAHFVLGRQRRSQ